MHNSQILSFRFGDKSVTLLPGYIFITHIRSGFMYARLTRLLDGEVRLTIGL